MELQEGKNGQEDGTKEKRSGAPDSPPPYDHAAFIRQVQTLTMEKRGEMLDKLMGIGKDF